MSEDKAKLNDSTEGMAFKEQVRQRVEIETMYEALDVRATGCTHWRWMMGMLGLSIQSSSRSIWIRVVDPPNDDTSECWPDLRDPATVGCLLSLVRETWNSKTVVTRYSEYQYGEQAVGEWDVLISVEHDRVGTFRQFVASTEAEALVKALEFAP